MCLSSLAANTELEDGGSLFLLQLLLSEGCFLQAVPQWEALSLRGGATWEQLREGCAKQAPRVLFGQQSK